MNADQEICVPGGVPAPAGTGNWQFPASVKLGVFYIHLEEEVNWYNYDKERESPSH